MDFKALPKIEVSNLCFGSPLTNVPVVLEAAL
jgi:hypothetical protein